MSFLEELGKEYLREYNARLDKNGIRRNTSRTHDANLGWGDPLDKRVSRPELRKLEDVRQAVQKKSPRRWARIQRDYKWAEKQMLKLGLNPEDTRFIL